MNEDLTQDEVQQSEWIRQNNLAYLGLLLVGIYMVQPFLTATSLDLSAKICVTAFSVAIPLLAALVMISYQEAFRQRATSSVVVNVTKAISQQAAFVGMVAGFWHIAWFAGLGTIVAAAIGVGVHSAGYMDLQHKQPPPPTTDEAHNDPSQSPARSIEPNNDPRLVATPPGPPHPGQQQLLARKSVAASSSPAWRSPADRQRATTGG